MRIYSMTATFGKLEHEKLTLEPGLNVISAGNEWGKSTWCAFLAVMLYGLDTRAKSTRASLADKERYAPWSGSPMSGRIDLNWQGRDITIERKTSGRIPMGDFRAYETASGLPLPELNAKNCGEMLLGVERSVFLRSGFIRFRDLSVTGDEAMRRRLNNLVSTGDENSAADHLAGELKSLKNRIRYNRTGLLPQAEAERDRLEGKLRELKTLEEHNDEILRRLDSNEDWRMALENHQAALAHAAAREDARKVSQARSELNDAREKYEKLDALCGKLPDRETARGRLDAIHNLHDTLVKLQTRLQTLPRELPAENLPEQFRDLTAEEAGEKVEQDAARHEQLRGGLNYRVMIGLVLCLAGLALTFLEPVAGLACCLVGLAVLIWGLIWKMGRNRERKGLEAFYGSTDPDRWRELAADYGLRLEEHSRETDALHREQAELETELDRVRQSLREITRDREPELTRKNWENVVAAWDAREEALRLYRKASDHFEDLKAMARYAKAPEFEDRLEYSEAYTARLLDECLADRTRLENLQGQCRGSMEAIGSKAELEKELERISARIRSLEHTYGALTVAQETLAQARQELQRRFAPRISRRAGEIMSAMTEGRYDRLAIQEDLSLRAGAQQEDTLHEALWRSDGTVDQLYLSLRLAVAEELLPQVPLVLDDALVRFDDRRLKAAMKILRAEAETKQVILFTCHSREANA